MTTKKLSKKALCALDHLKNGAQFRRRLETDSFTRSEKFRYRLLDSRGQVIRGFGIVTFYEVEHFLQPTGGGTSISDYYRIHPAHVCDAQHTQTSA